ncbi:MAG TPA: DUF3795 domain-containing protein [Candidatus Paceibacterota bacterium]|nr:DUF3795 domain-containing protein [Candidatus Paceibacterota bacterium]
MSIIREYSGFVPPCGIYCGSCPSYTRNRSPCPGAGVHCRTRKCKTIYVCCVEKRGLRFCYECGSYPCARFRQFAETWTRCGQSLIENQKRIAELGVERWLAEMQGKTK